MRYRFIGQDDPGYCQIPAHTNVSTHLFLHGRFSDRLLFLRACYTRSGYHDFAWLADHLARRCKQLQTLLLDGNELDNAGAILFAELARKQASLRELSLEANGIQHEGAEAVCAAVANHQRLRSLSLAYNVIGRLGARSIAQLLEQNCVLRILSLRDTLLGDDAASLIAGALKGNKALRILRLDDNRIGHAGAQALSDALCHNSTLHTLSLSKNPMLANHAAIFHPLLAVNRTLRYLHLPLASVETAGLTSRNRSWKQYISFLALARRDAEVVRGVLPVLLPTYVLMDIVELDFALSMRRCEFVACKRNYISTRENAAYLARLERGKRANLIDVARKYASQPRRVATAKAAETCSVEVAERSGNHVNRAQH